MPFTAAEENYIKTGKAKLVYRDFPLSFHQNAQKAAEAADFLREAERAGAFIAEDEKSLRSYLRQL